MTLEEARAYFARDLYATEATGIKIDAVGENYAKCSLDIEEKHEAADGHIMGGVMFTMADFAFAVATNTPGHLTVTLSSTISYLRQPKDKKMYAECFCVKEGKQLCNYETIITDGAGNKIAVVSASGMHVS